VVNIVENRGVFEFGMKDEFLSGVITEEEGEIES